MKYLIQKELIDKNDLDIRILLDKMNHLVFKLSHEIDYISLDNLRSANNNSIKNMIPIGTIEFVSLYINKVYGIERENPIEIPECLRMEAFLKRSYSILEYKDIPKIGNYFIKDATQLKKFSYTGEIENIHKCFNDDTNEVIPGAKLKLSKDHLYQVSEIVDILSEYRVYVLQGNIEAIVNYQGSPLVVPDTELIKDACDIYNESGKAPKSYTMDIMVTDRGTSLIEIHNFTSVGLYTTLLSNRLMQAYADGIDYLINCNYTIEKSK